MEILLLLIGLVVGALLGALAGVLWSRTRPVGAPLVEALQERAAGDAVIREGLERLGDQMRASTGAARSPGRWIRGWRESARPPTTLRQAFNRADPADPCGGEQLRRQQWLKFPDAAE